MLGFIHFGNQLDLSLAELGNFIDFDRKCLYDNFLLFNNSKFYDLPYDSMGGVRAAYRIVAKSESEFLSYLSRFEKADDKKHVLLDSNFMKPHHLRKICMGFNNIKFKYAFKATDYRPVRFQNKKDVFVYILKFKSQVYFLEAFFIANAKKYAIRDYKKPYRDAKLGMLPPKLSQMMLNIATNTNAVYDPFCGTGSLLMEAVLSGTKNVYGSDYKQENIEGTDKNLFFMQRKFGLNFQSNVFMQDVTKKFNDVPNFNALISEGYLGKPLHGNEPDNFLKAQMHTVFELYLDFFRNLSLAAKSDFELVMCYPIFPKIAADSDASFFNLLGKISEYGYELEPISRQFKIKTALYQRNNQFVHRLIFKLGFKKV